MLSPGLSTTIKYAVCAREFVSYYNHYGVKAANPRKLCSFVSMTKRCQLYCQQDLISGLDNINVAIYDHARAMLN